MSTFLQAETRSAMTLPSIDSLQFAFAERLAPWLLTYGLHSTLLLVAALMVARRLRSAAARERLWKLALLGPLVTASLPWGAAPGFAISTPRTVESTRPAIPIEFAASDAEGGPSLSGFSAAERVLGARDRPSSSRRHELAAAEGTSTAHRFVVLAGAWCLLALAGCAHCLLVRRRLVRRLGRREASRDGPLVEALARLTCGLTLAGRVRLTESKRLASPVALGRREICVPPRVREDLEPEEQESLLAHELAHLLRRDPLWLLCAQLLERVFFFQPLLRLVRARLSQDMELLADAWAVRRTEDPVRMARCLARVAEWVAAGEQPLLVPGMAAAPSQLVRRIESVLQPQDAPRARRSARLVVVVGLLGLGVASYAAPRVHGMSSSSRALSEARRELGASWADLLEDHEQVSSAAATPGSDPPARTQETPRAQVLISLGDTLRIVDTYRQPEFDRTEIVQGLGSIMLPTLGRVEVLGKTRVELERELRAAYAQYYELCDIHVQHTPVTQRIFLYGAVRRAGPRVLAPDTTVFEALTAADAKQAGGNLGRVRLIRPSPNDPLVFTIDIEAMLRTGDSSSNVLLRPGDILYVPALDEGPTAEALARERRELQEKIERYLAAQEAYERLRGARPGDVPPVLVSLPVDPRERHRVVTLSAGRLTYEGAGADVTALDVTDALAAAQPSAAMLEWLSRVSALAKKGSGGSDARGVPLPEPDGSLILRTTVRADFRETQVVLQACEALGIEVRKVQLQASSDGNLRAPKLIASNTGEVPAGAPRLDIELSLAQGTQRVAHYSLRWDLLGECYSASARLEGDSLEAVEPVLADLAAQKPDYHVVLVCGQGVVHDDVNAVLEIVIEAGFTNFTLVGLEER